MSNLSDEMLYTSKSDILEKYIEFNDIPISQIKTCNLESVNELISIFSDLIASLGKLVSNTDFDSDIEYHQAKNLLIELNDSAVITAIIKRKRAIVKYEKTRDDYPRGIQFDELDVSRYV